MAMTKIPKIDDAAKRAKEEIPLALRQFIDAVIVSSLVKEYLAEKSGMNILASGNCGMADSAAMKKFACEVPA